MIEAISEKTIKLLLESDKPITSKNIAIEIGMSESSVKHNMKEVRSIIAASNAKLQSLPGKGFWLEVNEEQRKKLNDIINEHSDKAYSFNYRRHYILDILFRKNADYTIQIFADDLGVGRNVIIKDLEAIEKWLGYFNIEMIRVRNKGVLIQGGEFDIRQAIIYNNTAYMNQMEMDLERPDDLDFRISRTFYNYFSKVYPKNDIYLIEDVLLNAEREMDYHFEDISFIQLMEYIVVTFQRITQGRTILENNVLNKCRISKREYDAAKHLITRCITKNQEYLVLEYHCMAAQFSLYGRYEEAVENSYLKNEVYRKYAFEFVEGLQKIIVNRTILVNDNLINDLALLFKKKNMMKSYQVINSNYLKHDIKKQLPSLYAIVLANIPSLEIALDMKFTENDITYFVMLIDNAMDDTIDEISILMITSFDTNTIKYLNNKIRRTIPNIRIEKTIDLNEIEDEDFSNYDIVLTTVLLDRDDALKISRRVDTFDLDLISKEVEKKRKIKQQIIQVEKSLFHEDLICCNFRAKRRDDVLEKGAQMLHQQGYCTDNFYNILLHNENFVSTAIGNGVAIPHGYKKEILRSGIAVIKLERPIDWDESEKVELVFVLAIDLDNPQEIYKFFSNFYVLIDDKERLEQIKLAENSKEVMAVIEDVGKIITTMEE